MFDSDLNGEPAQDPDLPYTFVGVLYALDRLAPREPIEEMYKGNELLDPLLDATYRRFKVTPALAQLMRLGDTVRCHIMLDGTMGAALVMRSRNLFDTRQYGFYIQPESNYAENPEEDFEDRTYSVWQAPVRAFSLGKRNWGIEKLKTEDAWMSSPQVAEAVIKSLLINNQEGNVS
jgi:hypothetical protein